MYRLAYRNIGGVESLVGNHTVSASGVGGIRWFELRGVTAGPETVFQESTYQPDTTWRWMGSAAMDNQGNLALVGAPNSFVETPFTGTPKLLWITGSGRSMCLYGSSGFSLASSSSSCGFTGCTFMSRNAGDSSFLIDQPTVMVCA
jgi:hypothetical protein